MNWIAGRQDTGYFKCKLFSISNKVDLYLLKYPVGSKIPLHIDPVTGKRHYRFNLVLWPAWKGGIFYGKCLLKLGPVIILRSDRQPHAVSEVKSGTRWVLSLGVAL